MKRILWITLAVLALGALAFYAWELTEPRGDYPQSAASTGAAASGLMMNADGESSRTSPEANRESPAPRGAERASTPPSPNTLAALTALALESDPYDADIAIQLRDAKAFCETGGAEATALIDAYRANGMIPEDDALAEASVRFLTQARARYCANAPIPTALATDRDLEGNAPQPDYRRVEALRTALQAEESPLLRTAMLNELEQIVMKTDSPSAFIRAVSTLMKEPGSGWSLGRAQLAGIASRERVEQVQRAAALTTYCRMSRTCGPETPSVLAYCAPARCYPGITLEQSISDSLSPSELRAYRGMLELLASRRPDPRPGG